jgi:hypothetical protein
MISLHNKPDSKSLNQEMAAGKELKIGFHYLQKISQPCLLNIRTGQAAG